MEDIWHIFPASMGEDQAWITYNHGYAAVAEQDARSNVVRIRVAIRNPTESGMPTGDEFPALAALDEALEEKLSAAGGVYVGRVTVRGHRFFYYYSDRDEDEIANAIDAVAGASTYEIQYVVRSDSKREYYWNELYPTADDWQVIQDLKVLDALANDGDVADKDREVMHWAYFRTGEQCDAFSSWARTQDYKIHHNGKVEDGEQYLVRYSHIGSMSLGDITHHTLSASRKARELGGEYDGWETSVERD